MATPTKRRRTTKDETFTFRMDAQLKAAVAEAALARDCSTGDWVRAAIKAALAQQEAATR